MEASVTPAWKAQARTHATAISTASTANSSLAASAYVSSAVPKAQHHHSQRRGPGFLCPRSRIVYMRAPFTRPHRRHVPSVLVPSRSGRRGRGDGLKCDVLVPGCPSPGELSEGEGENSRGPDGLRWRRGQRGSARSENLAVEQQAEEKPDNWDFVGSSGDSSGSGDEGSNPHEFTFSAENSVMVDQVRMLQHIHSCAHAEEDLAGGDARGIMRATAGGMKPRVLKASTPIRDIYKSEGTPGEVRQFRVRGGKYVWKRKVGKGRRLGEWRSVDVNGVTEERHETAEPPFRVALTSPSPSLRSTRFPPPPFPPPSPPSPPHSSLPSPFSPLLPPSVPAGPIDEDVVCMQADWPLTWTHITLATGVSVGSGIAGPEDVTMLTQATTCTAILCLQGEESLESFGVNWKAVQEQAEQCDVAMFRVPVPEFDQQKQVTRVAGMVEAVRLLASLLVTGHRVHVACATGKNCSPLVVLGYLTFFQGLAWSEAKAMIVDSVPSADPSHEAWEQLVLSAADGVGPHKRSGQDDGAARGAVPAPHIAGRAFPFSTPCPAGALSSGRGGRAQDDRASRGAVPAPHRAGRGRYTMPHPLTPSTHSPIFPLSSPLPYSLPRPGSSGAVSSGRGGRTQDDRTRRGEVPAAHRAGRTFPLSTLPAYFPCLPSPIPCLPLPGPAGAVSSGRGGRTQDDRASRGALPAAHRAGRGRYTMLQPPTPSLSPPPSSGITQARLVLSAADGVGAHRMTELAEEQYQRRIEQGAGAEGGGQTARDDWEEAQRRLITETLQHRVSADVTISQSLSKAASRQASSPKPREVQPREAQSFSPVVDSQMAPPLETPFQVPPTSLQHRVYADVAISQSLPKAASRQASSPKPREVQPREAQSFSPVVDSQIAPPLDTPFQQPHILDSVYSFVNDPPPMHGPLCHLSLPLTAFASLHSYCCYPPPPCPLPSQQQPHILDSVYSFVNDHHSHAWPLAAPPPADAPPAFEEGVLGEVVLDGEGVVGEVSSGVEERIALLEQKHLAAMAAARSATEQERFFMQHVSELRVRFFMQHVSELRESETAARMEAAAAHERIALLTAQERERELLSAHEAAEAKAQAAEERAADLANRIAQMEEMEAAAKEAAAVALERMQALAEQVKELSEKERAASARMGEMETRLEEASEKSAADHDLMVKLEDRAERAEKEARKAQEALGAANERVKFFFRVMRGLRDRERAAKEAMHAATDRLEAAVTEAENLRRKDELMREAWAVASERIELLTRQVQQVEGLKMEVKREAVDAAKVFLHESDEHRLMAAREELSAAEERERMLQAQLERLGAELAAARDDMAERDARLAAVAAEVAERERVVEESRAAIGAAEKRIKELEEQVGVAEERERKAKREAEEAEAVLAAALAAAETKDREYTLMETPQKTAAAAAAGAVSAVAAAGGASSAAGAAASGAADQLIARLQSQVAAMSSELEGARNAAAAASERSAFLMRQVARLKGTAAADAVSRSQGGSGGGKGEGSSSKHRVAALEVEIRALEKRERAARAEAEAEKARVRELAAQVGQLESKERAAREKLQSSQDRVGFFLRQAVELREREGASKSALKETFKKVEGLSHQVGLLQGELVRASKESGKSTDAVERLQLLTMELKENSIKKVPGSSKVNGFERSGAGLGVLKAPELTASNAAAAASNASSNGAASAAASKGVITGKGKEEKKDDDNDDFPGGSGSGGGGVGGRGASAQGKASSSGSRAGSPSFGALVGPSY
ncbi:unnamed protein product [Closterium sp. NIES-65]|nr:unnamed protein product [Closterium sp. NIES-65]